MKGHIRERSPGHWAIILDVNDPATGRRRRKWHSFKGTKREAHKECARLITEMDAGAYVETDRTLLNAFLDRWERERRPISARKQPSDMANYYGCMCARRSARSECRLSAPRI